MDSPLLILSTKLFAPPPRATLVPRPRLVKRLSEGLARPLTLVAAPAGFGKTTLVSEWRASPAGSGYPLAYLSLDGEDNDPSRFLTYLVAALRKLKPDLGEMALSLLQSPQQPPPLQAFLTGLINDLGEMRSPFALVLDDYHVITARPIHDALTFLLDHLPQPMHLVLLTRADPPLPLSRLRARDQLVEFRAADLRFTSSEAVAFFNQGMGLTLSADDIAGLEQRTEGWIAGLQLAALAIQTPRSEDGGEEAADFIAAFTGSHRYIADYLVAEVLSRQPDLVSSFLLQTSILGRMTGELCDRLTGRSDGLEMLSHLEAANLFLVPLDGERRWYRYHHLFADVLRTQLRLAYPDSPAGLHQRAAEWYEQNGFVAEAIQHALSAGDQLHAARLIENNALPMLMRGEATTVLNWMAAIAPLIGERPWLAINQSWGFICTGQHDLIEPVLQQVEKRIEPPGTSQTNEMRYHIASIRALAAIRRGETQQAIHLARQALDRLPEDDIFLRGVVMFTLGEASWSAGDLAGAGQAFAEASRTNKAANNLLAGVMALSSEAGLLIEQGELHRAAETYRSAVQMATRADQRILPAAAQACLGLSSAAYEWNDLDSARRSAQQALDLGLRWGNPDTMAGAHLMQARLAHAQGNSQDAVAALREADELARGQGVIGMTAQRMDALRVRLWLAQSNLEAAAGWAREQHIHPADEITYQRQIASLTLARILIAQNRADAALTLLERLQTQVEALGQTGRALEVLVLQSLALEQQGDATRALAVLARALTLGQAEGYARAFLDEGAPMSRLLRHAGSRGVAPKYAAGLLSQFDREPGMAPARQQPLIEPLTERELQVLHLMVDGLSNQEIADRLVVALGTIKTHTASLYRKLNVVSRSQASARARELGIL